MKLVVATALLTVIVLAQGLAAGEPSIQFMATGANWSDGSFTGHAFVCIQLPTNSGIKEDCFGFYPRTAGSIFGGPGVVDSEFDFTAHPPCRFANIQVSVAKTITVAQRQRVLTVINGWDKHFTFNASNCVSLANAVAAAVGLNHPTDTSYTSPVQYVQKLKELTP